MSPNRIPSSLFAPSIRRLTLGLGLATSLVAFEGLSVVAALPELGRDLTDSSTVRFLPLVMTVYLLASATAIAASGPVADSVRPRRAYRIGLLVFGLASLICGFSSRLWLLIALRLVQGAAGGMLIACSGAAVGLGYPSTMRARAYALASTIWGVIGVGGPALAAALLSLTSWRWIFWINAPLAGFALVIGWNAIPGPALGAERHRLDRLGVLLLVGLTTSAVAGLSDFSLISVAALAAAVALAFWFHRHSRRSTATKPPVLRQRHYAEMPFRGLALAAALAMSAGVGIENYLPLYLREGRGTSVALAAWSVLFLTVGWTTAANTVSRLYHRIPETQWVLIGAASLPPSILLAAISVWQHWNLAWLFLAYFLMGLGIGATTNACLTLAQAAAIDTEIGRATSAHQFLRSMALTLGTAIMGTIVLAWNPMLGANDPASAALLSRGVVAAHALALLISLAAVIAARGLVRYGSASGKDQPPPCHAK